MKQTNKKYTNAVLIKIFMMHPEVYLKIIAEICLAVLYTF